MLEHGVRHHRWLNSPPLGGNPFHPPLRLFPKDVINYTRYSFRVVQISQRNGYPFFPLQRELLNIKRDKGQRGKVSTGRRSLWMLLNIPSRASLYSASPGRDIKSKKLLDNRQTTYQSYVIFPCEYDWSSFKLARYHTIPPSLAVYVNKISKADHSLITGGDRLLSAIKERGCHSFRAMVGTTLDRSKWTESAKTKSWHQ